jgi:uncharacterized protein (TIGR00251 family)
MVDQGIQIREREGGVEVSLHVQPRARREEIVGIHGGALKLKIAAPPVADAANRAILDFFAELLSLPKSRLRILAGEKSRRKTLRIEGISRSEFLDRCELDCPGLKLDESDSRKGGGFRS